MRQTYGEEIVGLDVRDHPMAHDRYDEAGAESATFPEELRSLIEALPSSDDLTAVVHEARAVEVERRPLPRSTIFIGHRGAGFAHVPNGHAGPAEGGG